MGAGSAVATPVKLGFLQGHVGRGLQCRGVVVSGVVQSGEHCVDVVAKQCLR